MEILKEIFWKKSNKEIKEERDFQVYSPLEDKGEIYLLIKNPQDYLIDINYAISLGERIKKRRQQLNLSQKDIQEKTGGKIKQAHISMIENNKTWNMTLETKNLLKKVLSVSDSFF